MKRALDREQPEAPPRWLHNMSAPPRTTISYSGLAELVGAAKAPSESVREATCVGLPGVALRFELPPDYPTAPDGLLLLLTGGTDPDAAAALEALINERALGADLPDGCLVLRPDPAHDVACADALTVLAILTKCSDCVWLRHKSPSLSRLERQQAVSLLLPPAFAAAFQGKPS